MRTSLRQRLLTLTVLGAIAFIAALVTIVRLARTGHQQRIERAHEEVENEVDRLRTFEEAPATWRRAPRVMRGPGALRSGYLEESFGRGAGPGVQPILRELRGEADVSGTTVSRQIAQGEGTVVVALARTPSGRHAWAASWVAPQRAAQPWRIGLLVLSLATLALLVASVETLYAFRRGAGALRESLGALEKDLRAPVSRPSIRELGDVAEGIEHLARELASAQAEHERLTLELAQRERLASLGRVAAGVAHEVRNPLASMKLRVDLAERAAGLPPAVASDLAEVSSEIQRLDRLVSDLLAITGKRLAARVPTDLGALARERASKLEPWAAEQGVLLAVNGTAWSDVDRDALSRAVDNLMRNAVQSSPRGGEVDVTVDRTDAGTRVVVRDRGEGVPPAREAELFEPFFTTRAEGTGLGLALSRAIATAHGGTLTYERTDGETRFIIALPSTPAPTDTRAVA